MSVDRDEVRPAADGTAVVAQGLDGAERVVLSGQSRLADGVRVTAAPAS